MSDLQPRSLTALPWSTDLPDLLEQAKEAGDTAACCLFAVAESIPQEARNGYAALIIAYTRDGEPVSLFDDGSALLLIREGGLEAGRAVGRRILAQLDRLGLAKTVSAAVAEVGPDAGETLSTLRKRASSLTPGEVSVP